MLFFTSIRLRRMARDAGRRDAEMDLAGLKPEASDWVLTFPPLRSMDTPAGSYAYSKGWEEVILAASKNSLSQQNESGQFS